MKINWIVYSIECAAFIAAFTCMIMIPLCKNPVWWIHDYPKDIQEKYFETYERVPVKMFSPTVAVKKGLALIFALTMLVFLMIAAGARNFVSGFLLSYCMWFIIDWYDCFFLDWVLFANIKKIRLPGTENMDKEYHQKKYHFFRSLLGMVFGLVPCFFCGLILELIF